MTSINSYPQIPKITPNTSLIYNWAHYVMVDIAYDRNKYETVSRLIE